MFFTVLFLGNIIQVVCESPVEVIKSEEVDSTLQTVYLNEERAATPEPTEIKLKREDRKSPRNSLMAFLRQMVSHLLLAQKTLKNLDQLPRIRTSVTGGMRCHCRWYGWTINCAVRKFPFVLPIQSQRKSQFIANIP